MRIFLDANILFSAAKSAGAVHESLERLLSRKHLVCADQYVVAAARRNLSVKASAESLRVLDALLGKIEIATAGIGGTDDPLVSWLPEKDRPVLAAAIRQRCNALVTGDLTHFGAGFGKSFGGVAIYSPRMLAELLIRGN